MRGEGDQRRGEPNSRVERRLLVGRRVRLAGVNPEFYESLYSIAVSERVAFRWRTHGVVPSPEEFERTLWRNVFRQYAVMRHDDEHRPIGLVVAHTPRFSDGVVSLAAVGDVTRGIGMFEGLLLFIRYLLVRWNFRKVYLEAPEFNVEQYRKVVELGYLVEEARLKGHWFHDGQYWDEVVHSVSRADFFRGLACHPGLID